MAQEFEARMTNEVLDVALRAGEEIIETDHFVPGLDQPLAQMRTDESGASCDENRLAVDPVLL